MTNSPKQLVTLLAAFGMLSIGGLSAANARPANSGQTWSQNNSKNDTHRRAKRSEKRAKKRQQRIAKFDINRDGKLDKGERISMKKQRFVLLDANQNGSVTIQEIRQFRKAKREKRLATRPVKRQAKRDARMAKRDARMAKRFTKRDLDKNGSITWDEFAKDKQHKGKFNRRRRGNRGQRGLQRQGKQRRRG